MRETRDVGDSQETSNGGACPNAESHLALTLPSAWPLSLSFLLWRHVWREQRAIRRQPVLPQADMACEQRLAVVPSASLLMGMMRLLLVRTRIRVHPTRAMRRRMPLRLLVVGLLSLHR